MLSADKIRVEMADKTRAIGYGGIGLIHQLAHATGLVEAVDRRVLRMEFRTFVNALLKIPCQIIRAGRKLIYRVLSYNP